MRLVIFPTKRLRKQRVCSTYRSSHVFGVVTFYTMFRRDKPARHRLHVCSNIGCIARSGYDAMEHVHKRLGIHPGQTTPDGLFSLDEDDDMIGCEQGASVVVDGHAAPRTSPSTSSTACSTSCAQSRAARGTADSAHRRCSAPFVRTPGEKIVTKNIGVPGIRKLVDLPSARRLAGLSRKRWACSARPSSTRSRSRTCAGAAARASRPA